MNNIVIGITGGIGSGKSTVSKILEDKGFKVLKSDEIAKNIMINDHSVSARIQNQFGNDCYKDGKLQTKVLADKVFNHPDKIGKLNSIVHPPTIRQIEKEINEFKSEEGILFVESALIFEAKMSHLFDYILLISADEDTRIKRVLERDLETVSEIKSRIMNQISEEQKKGKSDFIIENVSSIEKLEEKTLFFLNLFKSLPQKHQN